jgi:chromosome segregation ATPase
MPARHEAPTRHFKSKEEDSPMKESIADLERRRDLLKEIKELYQSLPDEDYMSEVADHHATLKAIADHPVPDEDWMKEVDDHYATLKAIEEINPPTDAEIQAASDHYDTLTAIENRSN